MTLPLKKFLLAALLFMVSTGVFYYWQEKVSSQSEKLAAIQNNIALQSQNTTNIALARAVLNQVSGLEAAMGKYFVSDGQVVNLIDDLTARVQGVGAAMSIGTVTSVTTPHPAIVLTLSIKGTFASVMRAIGVIEYAPYTISVSSLSLGQLDKGGWDAELTVTVGSASSKQP